MEPNWLLVTTSKSLLLIHRSSGQGYRIDEGRGLYYGMAMVGNQLWVGARHRLVSSSLPPEQERGQILVFNPDWRCHTALEAPFPLRDIHQILWHHDRLWVTCPFENSVAIYDPAGRHWVAWYPLGLPEDGPKDINHFNSLAIFDQRLCIVAHNKGASDLLFFQLPDCTLVDTIRLGQQAHNVWRHGNGWATCSSGEGKLVSTDGWTVETGGFPRGMAVLGEETCIGISEIAERHQRDLTTSQLLFYNPDWALQRRISLMNEGLVLDLAPMPETWALPTPPSTLIEFPTATA